MNARHLCANVMLTLAAAAAMAGCVTRPRTAAAPLPGKPACIFSSTVQDWQVLDDQTLIVHAPLQKDAYLIKLFEPIIGLRFHETLGFVDGDHNGQLCSTGDSVVVRGAEPQSSPILAVRLLTPAEVKQLEANAGIKSAVHRDNSASSP